MFYKRGDHYTVENFSKKQWQNVYDRVIGGVVFIEDCLAECLHWDGGLENLFDKGAIDVKSLSPFECGEKNQRKAVFICRGYKMNLDTIKAILSESDFAHCVVAITTDTDIISFENNGLGDLQELIMGWISKKPCSVEVFYAPIFAVSITNNIFTTPIYSQLFPKFADSLNIDSTASVDLHSLPLEDKNQVRRLALNLSSLLQHLDAREDIYYMGSFSSILAGVLEYLPAAETRRKTASNNVSLILVDRTLDLCSVSSQQSESALDKMMGILPRLPGHSLDVAVDMSSVCQANAISPSEDIHLCPGCISHPHDAQSIQMLQHMVHKSQQEVMLGLYSRLANLSVSATPTRLPPRVTPQHLEKIIQATKGRYELLEEHSELLQQSLALLQTIKSPHIRETDLLTSLEQQILQNLSTSRDSTSVLTQISMLIKNRKQRNMTLERLLSLLVYLYSVAGVEVVFSGAQQGQLVDALRGALQEDGALGGFNEGERGAELMACRIVERLKDVAATRRTLTKYRSVMKVPDSISPTEYRGVLPQLLNDLLDVDRTDVPDLKSRTDKLKGLLRSGLNMLMSTASKKPTTVSKHPFDNPLVILYIVGGTTATECHRLHQTVMTSGSDVDVWIGSTCLLNPIETMRHALFLDQ